MYKGNRLLDYALLLDPSLSVCGLTRSFGLEELIAEGAITDLKDVESYMRCQLHPTLTMIDGLAIKGMYAAIKQGDGWRLALIDKILYAQRTPHQLRVSGKRLMRLAKALYPWIDFHQLERIFMRYGSIGTLAAIHAWINFQLETEAEQAVQGYLTAAVSACVNDASRLLHPAYEAKSTAICRLTEDVLHEWERIKKSDPVQFQRPLLTWNLPGTYIKQPYALSSYTLRV